MVIYAPSPQIQDFITFIDSSPTAWHAVDFMKQLLLKKGFIELHENEKWRLDPGKSYFVTRNAASICAFAMPLHTPFQARVLAAHTDSPGLKLKPYPEYNKENMVMFGVEIYGAPLLNSWLNRDLGLAGRLSYLDTTSRIRQTLVDIRDYPMVIPQLAIHLDRKVNEEGLQLNKQEHLAVLAAIESDWLGNDSLIERMLKEKIDYQTLLSADLFVYPLEPARLMGFAHDLIAGYRLDNLASAFACLEAIQGAEPLQHQLQMAIFWDHEEIGSSTASGADSNFFSNCLERIALACKMDRESYFCLMQNSLCLSVDLAHALHPNYSDKHEPRHPVLLNKGIVLKFNAQHKYASDAKSSAFIIQLCHQMDIPLQRFVARGDIPSGSTIGPIHASRTGMPTVDIGIAQLSMHSSRELIGTHDLGLLCQLLKAALNSSI